MSVKRSILCIDLKSFYASCECLLLNKDPFTTPLVVASKTQGPGAITLAVTPYMKSLGVKSRGRLFEIPQNIKYEIIHPKMGHYVEKSKEVISVYLNFVSSNDLHVYSIDEAFLDVTNYLKFYNMTPVMLANEIMKKIYTDTGLRSTCGIGENMFIAKTAMDIEAKKNKNNIAYWDSLVFKEKILCIKNLTDMWGIGKNMEKKLNNLQIFSVRDLAYYDKTKLIKSLGLIGEELWNHANGIDEAVISENVYYPKNVSFGSSQILFKNYNKDNIKIIIMETVEILTKRLRKNEKVCKKVSLSIGYDYEYEGGFSKSVSFSNYTRDNGEIYDYCLYLLDKYIMDFPIRKIGISLGTIMTSNFFQPSLFTNYTQVKNNDNLNKTIDLMQNKYGKNSIFCANALLDDSTIIDRNKKLGGHSL